MPCINHKRKSFKSINHKTSRKSKRSTKHKSRSFRNKKTRSNVKKMRGGGINYPEEYDEIVIRNIGGSNTSKHNIYIATGYYMNDKLIPYNNTDITFDNKLHKFSVLSKDKNEGNSDIEGLYKNFNILKLGDKSEYFTIVQTEQIEESKYTPEKQKQLKNLQSQIDNLQSQIDNLYITETLLKKESVNNNTSKTEKEDELHKFKLNTNTINELEIQKTKTKSTFELHQLQEQLEHLKGLVYNKSEKKYNDIISNLTKIINKGKEELNNIPITIKDLILQKDTILNQLHLAQQTLNT